MIKPIGVQLLDPNSDEAKVARKELAPEVDKKKEEPETAAGETIQVIDTSGVVKDVPVQELKKDPTPAPEEEGLMAGIFEELVKEGKLTYWDEEAEEISIKTKEDIFKLIDSTRDNVAKSSREEWISSLSPEKKQFLEIADATGDSSLAAAAVEDLKLMKSVTDENIDEDEELAEHIVSRDLYLQGLSHQSVAERIEDLKNLDKLKSKAKEVRPAVEGRYRSIIKHRENERQAQANAAQEQYNNYVKGIHDTIETSDELIPGYKLTNLAKEKMKRSFTDVVHTDESGRTYTAIGHKQYQNPEQFAIAMEMLNNIGLLEFDKKGNWKPDLEKIKKVVTGKVAAKVDNMIEQERDLDRKSPTTTGAFGFNKERFSKNFK